jgi:hypothetical protein
MRLFAALLLLGFLPLAQAQVYKCKDDRGRWVFSDKPLPGCADAPSAPTKGPETKASGTTKPPVPRAAKAPPLPHLKGPGAKPPAPSLAKGRPASPLRAPPSQTSPPSAQENSQFAAQCKASREQLQWLEGPRGAGIENREARVAQVRQALSQCR